MFAMFDEEEEFQGTSNNFNLSPPSEERKDNVFAGLQNQGTTCYLNSLLQVLYMTDQFREAIFELPSSEIGEDPQILGSYELPKQVDGIQTRRVIIRLRELFALLHSANQVAISTSLLTESFGWKNNDIGVQHDVTELNRVLIDAIQRSLLDVPSGEQLIPSLFNGTTVNRLRCWGCEHERDREELFQDIILQVEGCSNILESLSQYVSPTELSGDNKYECDICTIEKKLGKQKARMAISFKTIPKVFTLSLSRFGYNWETMQRYKISSTCKFPLIIDMAPYLADNVTKNLTPSIEDSVLNYNYTKTIPSENLMDSKINEQSEYLYELSAVVIHSGSAHGGHYYAYIKDDSTNKWYEFNDASVKEIPESSIATQYGGKNNCAYMLSYRKIESYPKKQNVIEKKELPPCLKNYVEKYNEKLQLQRKEWEKEQAMINVELFLCSDFDLSQNKPYPMVMESTVQEKEEDAGLGGLFELFDQGASSQYETKPGRIIRIDGTTPISELFLRILVMVKDEIDSTEMDQYRMDVVSWSNYKKTPVELSSKLSSISNADLWTSANPIDTLQIVNNTKILFWKGNEMSFSSDITVYIEVYLDSNSLVETISCIISDLASIGELKQQIEDHTGMEVEKQYICKKHVSFISGITANNETSLIEIGIEDQNILTVELLGDNNQCNNIANTYFERKRNELRIYLINGLSNESNEPQECICSKEDTVQELLFQAISLFQISQSPNQLALFYNGEKLNDLEFSLELCPIANESILTIKEDIPENNIQIEIPPKEFTLTVEFYEYLEEDNQESFSQKLDSIPKSFEILSTSTLEEIKGMMISLLDSEISKRTFRLRRLNFMQEKQQIEIDESKTLNDIGVDCSNFVIQFCLEEGSIPVPGEIELQIYEYTHILPSSCTGITLFSPVCFFPRASRPEELVEINDFIKPGPIIKISKDDSLKKLKSNLIDGGDENEWKTIRIWSSGKLLTKDKLSLKKNGINHGSFIVKEHLEFTETLTGNDTIVYLYKWEPDTNSSGTFTGGKRVQFTSSNATVEEFREFVREEMDIEEGSTFEIAKYFYHGRCWKLIEPKDTPSYLTEKSGKKARSKIQQLKNLRRNNNYLLANGDIIVVYENNNLSKFFPCFLGDSRILQKPEKTIREYESYINLPHSSSNRYSKEVGLSIDIGFES